MRYIAILLLVSLSISVHSPFIFTPAPELSNFVFLPSQINFPPTQNPTLNINLETKDSLGNQELFWIYDYYLGDIQIQATLLSVGDFCYIYMADSVIAELGVSTATSKYDRLRDEFDQTIYPTGVELAGNPDGRFGDIDGDPKVTVLLAPIDPYGGYYRFEDEDPSDPHSNHREMIFVNSNKDIRDIIKTTAHEFNHLIWGNYEQDEAPFLLEGAANYALYYSGFLSNWSYITSELALNLCAETYSFSFHPELPLLGWHNLISELMIADYGQAYLFMFYLAEKYGENIIAKLVVEELDGPLGIDNVLASAGYNITFNELYLDWITACTIDEVSFGDGLYGFTQVDFTMNKINSYITTFPTEIVNKKYHYYGFDIKKVISPPNEFIFQITTPPSHYSLGLSIIICDANGWNVSQTLVTTNDEVITLFLTGNTIEFVYIVTSLMSNSTPITYTYNGIYYAHEAYVLLDCLFIEGHVLPSETEVSGFTLTFNLLLPILFCIRILITRSKKSYTYH